MLNGEATAHLMERANDVQLAVGHWVKSLPAAQQEGAIQRILHDNPLAQVADSLDQDPQASARFKRNPSLKDMVQSFIYYTW
jgi:hypothetical protein